MDAPPVQYAISNDGTRIAYRAGGSGPGILFLHPIGTINSEAEWETPVVRRWLEGLAEDHTLITVDLRGHGLSDRKPGTYHVDNFAADTVAVAEKEASQELTVFGTMDAALVALVLARRAPELVSRLVLWTPVGQYNSDRRQALDALGSVDSDLQGTARATDGLGYGSSDIGDFAEFLTRVIGETDPLVHEARRDPEFGAEILNDLTSIGTPTLVLHPRDSRLVPLNEVRRFAAQIPNAELQLLPGPGFAPYGDRQAVVLDAIRAFEGHAHPSPNGPSRFRTILFTDLAASTATTQRLGDEAAQEIVRSHDDIVRDALRTYDGHEIKHTGDGIMAWFPAASNALDCARTIQTIVTETSTAGLAVKIGINAGEPIAEEDDLYGTAVQIAARVTDQAAAGEIVVTNVVRELVAGKGYLFGEREPAALKGVEEPVRLFTVS